MSPEALWSATHDQMVSTVQLSSPKGSKTVSNLTLPAVWANYTSLSLTCEAVFGDKVVLSKTKHVKILSECMI